MQVGNYSFRKFANRRQVPEGQAASAMTDREIVVACATGIAVLVISAKLMGRK